MVVSLEVSSVSQIKLKTDIGKNYSDAAACGAAGGGGACGGGGAGGGGACGGGGEFLGLLSLFLHQ